MKHFIPAVLLCCIVSSLFAQTTFKLSPSPAWISSPPSVFDSPAKAHIVNRTNATITLRWQRIIVSVPSGISTQVCDLNLCYAASISTRTFDLSPLDTGNLDLHFVNETGVTVDPPAEVRVKVSNVNVPADTFTAVYYYTTAPLSAKNPESWLSNAKIYPNPGAAYFMLENAEGVSALQLCHADGRLIRRFQANLQQRYDAADLPAGTYLVVLENDKGAVLRTLTWQHKP